jgi:DNA-binding transcriptional regulator LsrR (DeoR family)
MKKKFSKEELNKLYYEDGLSQQQIANQYNISAANVFRQMKEHGLAARSTTDIAFNKANILSIFKKCSLCKKVKEKSTNFYLF